MFKLQRKGSAATEAVEYIMGTAAEAITLGEALVLSSGKLKVPFRAFVILIIGSLKTASFTRILCSSKGNNSKCKATDFMDTNSL